jgi:alpha-beta hydrolase superfamily lysophospholipase
MESRSLVRLEKGNFSTQQEDFGESGRTLHKEVVWMKRHIWRILSTALGALLALGAAGLFYYGYSRTSAFVDGHIEFEKVYEPAEFGIEAERVQLTTEDGLRLAAWRVDAEEPRAAVIFASGFHGPSVTNFFGHAAMLQQAGYSSMLVELRGRGESEGDMLGVGTTEYLDIRAAVFYLKKMDPALPVAVFGFSMGGTAAINAMGETPEIDALIALSAASSWPDMLTDRLRQRGVPGILCAAEKPFVWLTMGIKYGFDQIHINPRDEIRKLDGRPALLMHSRGDQVVPFESFLRLTEAAPQAETYVIDGDRHRICAEGFFHAPMEDAAYAEVILSFLERTFP